MAATNWTYRSCHNGTTTTLRIETSDNTEANAYFPDNGATFDARGRLATYPVWAAAYDDEGGDFKSTRATVRVIRDRYTGRIVRYEAREDFGGTNIVSGRTREDIRGAFGSAVARDVMQPIWVRAAAAWREARGIRIGAR